MTPSHAATERLSGRAPIDVEGELLNRPVVIGWILAVLGVLTAFEALEEVFRIDGPSWLYETWSHDLVAFTAAILVLSRSYYEPRTRRPWLIFGIAMLLWSVGSIGWSAAYGGRSHVPYPSFADILWLLWYPLMAAGITLLIKVRVQRFELTRWMDGIAVVLLVLAGGFAIVIEPVARQTLQGTSATLVDFSYPVLDLLLIGAILGVYGLLGWRPDAMWLLLGLGIVATTLADAVFAVQEAHGLANERPYDFVWTLGTLLIACAAWATSSPKSLRTEVTGLRAIALVLAAQAVAAGIQIYAFFGDLGRSERIVTLLVLAVTSVQVVLARPRAMDPLSGLDPSAEASDPVMAPLQCDDAVDRNLVTVESAPR
jgi:diguanylate cyclase